MKVDRIIEAGICAMLAVFVGTLYMSLHENVVKAGDKAPDFTLHADNGRTVTPHDFGGKLLLVNFWASYCVPCVEEMPALNEMSRELGPRGLVVLAVSSDKEESAYKQFLAKNPVSFMTVLDPGKDVQTNYGTILIPESYLIDSKGKVLEKFVSSQAWASPLMIDHVQSLLKDL
jgi:cytochrome c biogenesis protein CcmG, thiol:disulfide interchange protein DsbE